MREYTEFNAERNTITLFRIRRMRNLTIILNQQLIPLRVYAFNQLDLLLSSPSFQNLFSIHGPEWSIESFIVYQLCHFIWGSKSSLPYFVLTQSSIQIAGHANIQATIVIGKDVCEIGSGLSHSSGFSHEVFDSVRKVVLWARYWSVIPYEPRDSQYQRSGDPGVFQAFGQIGRLPAWNQRFLCPTRHNRVP